jgi:hypothetical protein
MVEFLVVRLFLSLSFAYAFTISTLSGMCTNTTINPLRVYSEDLYTYILISPTSLVSWDSANQSCGTLFSSGIHSQLASYRSSTVQLGLQNASKDSGVYHMFIGFGLINSATATWLDPMDNYSVSNINLSSSASLSTTNNIVAYNTFSYDVFPQTENISANYVCEVLSKLY